MATLGWSGPKLASSIRSARSKAALAPARSPRSCSTSPRLLTSVATSGWSGPKARLVDPERPLEGRPGARQIAQVPQHRAQVVDVDRDLRAGLGPRAASAERSAARVVAVLGTLEFGTGSQVSCRLVQQPPRALEIFGALLGVTGGGEGVGEQSARRRPGCRVVLRS